MTCQHSDYYGLLGIGRRASAAKVDRAYRRAARATHPDVNPADVSAAERFRAVTTAHETLSDPRRRAAYDHAHPLVSRTTPIPAIHHSRETVAPVHLGRRKPQAEPLRSFQTRALRSQPKDLFELVEMLSRFMLGRPPI